MEKRQIKFRGKRIDNGEWVHGFYSEYVCPEYFDKFYEIHTLDGDIVDVDPDTVGQFTGVKDFYEGDCFGGESVAIIYNESNGCFMLDGINGSTVSDYFDEYDMERMKVTGNIHEGASK